MTIISKERMYEVIRAPHITEKSTLISEHNAVAFKVAIDATKPEICGRSVRGEGQGGQYLCGKRKDQAFSRYFRSSE